MPRKRPLTLPSPPRRGEKNVALLGEGGIVQERVACGRKTEGRKRRGKEFPLLGESHHGGSATRKLMKIATPRFVAGLTGVIPGFWEGIFEVG